MQHGSHRVRVSMSRRTFVRVMGWASIGFVSTRTTGCGSGTRRGTQPPPSTHDRPARRPVGHEAVLLS
ncbi:MAG: hypothetical protein NZ898_16925 [Myxococcota bacterium]|nr:hypothetical protein [Myxococcota bacterium]